jgi:OmpA-OmpF porin, OOP family
LAELSEARPLQRAEAVVEYLVVAHKIPARRFITPMGYGKTGAVAGNTTAQGRAQNRRVEVKMLLNRGMNSSKTAVFPPYDRSKQEALVADQNN